MSDQVSFAVGYKPHRAQLQDTPVAPDRPATASGVAAWSPRDRFAAAGGVLSLRVLDGWSLPSSVLPDLVAPGLDPDAALDAGPPPSVIDETVALDVVERVAEGLELPCEVSSAAPVLAGRLERAAAEASPHPLFDAAALEATAAEPEWTSDPWPADSGQGMIWAGDPGQSVPVHGRSRWRVLFVALGALALVVLVAFAAMLLPGRLATRRLATGTYNAPVLVVRAGGPGAVVAVLVTSGQTVLPDSVLMRLSSDPAPDPAASAARAQLGAAQIHLQAAEAALAQATAGANPGQARMQELRQQRGAAALDALAAREAVDKIVSPEPVIRQVTAGLHGVVGGVEVKPGSALSAGMPLARLLDCDRAFLTIPPDAPLSAGQSVSVQLAGQKAVVADVRPSSGIAQPPDSLVVPLDLAATGGQCPVGASVPIMGTQQDATAISPGRGNSP